MNKTGSKANVKCLKCAGFISYPSLLRLQNGEEIWVKDAHQHLFFVPDLSLPTKSLEQDSPENCKLLFRRKL